MYMGQTSSNPKYSFREVQQKKGEFILMNTLPLNQQSYLIKGTLPALEESQRINEYLQKNKKVPIIIYGLDHQDVSVGKKFIQLKTLGFENVFVYMGGIFEWALLQEIYGSNFPSEGTISDPLELYKKIDG
jgi:hypothetical protein